MVLQVLYTAATTVLPFNYWPHAAVAVAVLLVIYAYAQGRSTTRERDLHARVIILTVSPSIDIGLLRRGRNWPGEGEVSIQRLLPGSLYALNLLCPLLPWS